MGRRASGIYRIHVKELQVQAWLYRLDSDTWLLEDTICLAKLCAANLGDEALPIRATCTCRSVWADWLGPDAKFVFIKMGSDAFHVDPKRRTVEACAIYRSDVVISINIFYMSSHIDKLFEKWKMVDYFITVSAIVWKDDMCETTMKGNIGGGWNSNARGALAKEKVK
jgi:hypothetical protein